MRRSAQTKLMDRFHRGFVCICMGLTAYGMVLLGNRVYRHFTVIRPEIKAYEQSLLKHGSLAVDHKTEDNAPKMNA